MNELHTCEFCSFPRNPTECLYCDSRPETYITTECMHLFCEKCIQIQKNFLVTKKQLFYREPNKCEKCGKEAAALCEDLNNPDIFLCEEHFNSSYLSIKPIKYSSDQSFKVSFQGIIQANIEKLEKIIEILSETKSHIFNQINLVVKDTMQKCLEEIRNLTKLKYKLHKDDYFSLHNYKFIERLSLQSNPQIHPEVKTHLIGLKRLLSVDLISQNYQNYDLFYFNESTQQLIATNLLTKKIMNFPSSQNFLIDSQTQIVKYSTKEFLVIGKVFNGNCNKVYKLNLQDNLIQEAEPTPFKIYCPGLVHLNRIVYAFTGGENCLKYSVDHGRWTSFKGFFIGNERIFAHLFVGNILVSTQNGEAIFKFYPDTEVYRKYYQLKQGPKIFATDTVITGDNMLNLRSKQKRICNFPIFNFENFSMLSSAVEIDGEICFYMKTGELVSVDKSTFSSKMKFL